MYLKLLKKEKLTPPKMILIVIMQIKKALMLINVINVVCGALVINVIIKNVLKINKVSPNL